MLAVQGIAWLSSCSVVPRNYPKNTPFVYDYNIHVEEEPEHYEKSRLESGLKNQLDDSIRVRTVRKFFAKGFFNRPVLDKPPVYKNENADRSVIYMRSLLNSLGFFRDSVWYDTSVVAKGDGQLRTIVNFHVSPGKLVTLDTVKYNFGNTELQPITDSAREEAIIKKGDPFAKVTISQELDRLVNLYRNNGYMQFTREELIGLWDTLNPAILNPTLDPFEQIAILDSIRKSRINPKAILEIRFRPGFDSSRIKKYYTGDITVIPDFNYFTDTTGLQRKNEFINGVRISYFKKLFKPKILPPNIYFRKGEIYSQQNVNKTINRFNVLESWRLVSIEEKIRPDQDTADFTIKLSPARKYSFTANLEGSRNNNAFSGNLFGIAVNVGLQNRNFAKSANQSITNIRYNIETGRDTVAGVSFIQTNQLILSHTVYIPRPVLINNLVPEKYRNNVRTSFAINIGSTQRRQLYNLSTFNTSWGYELQTAGKYQTRRISFRPFNIEYSLLDAKPKLNEIFDNNPSLRNIFTDGLISSSIGGFVITREKNNNASIFRFNTEWSGLLSGLIHSNFLDTNLYRFVKADFDYAYRLGFRKSALVLRFFAGIGYELNSTVNPQKRNSLPFFRQYFAGGPNSMRGWALRKLGPGSLVKDFGTNGAPDRYGDLQLETNIEYRFKIATISGSDVSGAFFSDIGNIWYLKEGASEPKGVFNINRLFTDLAVSTGMGLRVDFGFFVVRLDFSVKAKDPSPSTAFAHIQNKWFGYFGESFRAGSQFQLGISYPFIQ